MSNGPRVRSARLQAVQGRVLEFLRLMELPVEATDDAIYFFRFGSTVVTLSLFEDENNTYVRVASTLLKDFELSVELMMRLFKLNTQVLFGAFLLFDERTLSFCATLLGNNLDYNELATTLSYVARISDDYDDQLQKLAGGMKASDILQEGRE